VITVEVRGLPAHLLAAIEPDASGCWLWQRARSDDGYGWASLNDRTYQAHRLIYRLVVGEIPDGLVLDHLCRVRHCVNPEHLEPVTPGENIRRSEITPAGQTHCLKCGGPFSQLRGQRRCLTCLAAYEGGRRELKRDMERERRRRIKERGA